MTRVCQTDYTPSIASMHLPCYADESVLVYACALCCVLCALYTIRNSDIRFSTRQMGRTCVTWRLVYLVFGCSVVWYNALPPLLCGSSFTLRVRGLMVISSSLHSFIHLIPLYISHFTQLCLFINSSSNSSKQ